MVMQKESDEDKTYQVAEVSRMGALHGVKRNELGTQRYESRSKIERRRVQLLQYRIVSGLTVVPDHDVAAGFWIVTKFSSKYPVLSNIDLIT